MTASPEDGQRACFLEASPGYSPNIGVLVAMMGYARLTTVQAVHSLSVEELDAIPPGFSNSIGMLLAHSAAVDRVYQRLIPTCSDSRTSGKAPDVLPSPPAGIFCLSLRSGSSSTHRSLV